MSGEPSPVKFPYYPFYPRDFIADGPVMQLDDLEELMYRRLLDYQWLNGFVPNAGIAKAARMSARSAAKYWVRVSTFFPVWEDGERRNRRMERERERMIAMRGARSNAGIKGMAVRYQTSNAVTNKEPNNPLTKSNMAVAVAVAVAEKETTTNTPSPPRARREALMAEVLADPKAAEFREEFEGAFRSSEYPESLAAEFRSLMAGFNMEQGRSAPLPVIGQAIRDMRVARAAFTPKTLRIFASALLRPVTVRGQTKPSPGERALAMAERQHAAGDV